MTARTGNSRNTVVVCNYRPEILVALFNQDAEVCLVLDRVDQRYRSPDQQLLDQCAEVYRISTFDSIAELSAVAVDIRGCGRMVAEVFSNDELSQFGVGYLRLLLGATANPLHHVACRDKRLMKELVRGAGVPTTEFRSLPDAANTTALTRIAGELSAPLIVKPASGYGSNTTEKVDDAGALGTVAGGLTFDMVQRSHQLIVEEYVTGEELCVDAVWSGEKALTFVVHKYLKPRMTVLDNGLDGSLILLPEDHPDLYGRLREMHARLNPALGIESGPTHLEVFERPDGELIFSEIATRPGGGWIQYMIGAHHGHSPWSLAVSAALTGTIPPLSSPRRYVGGISIRPTTPGVITHMPTEEELLRHPAMITWHRRRQIGERARCSGPSDWYMFLILGADSEDELIHTCTEAARTFTVQTDG
ncbi:ATP-grasp domain-containing protein [Salinispora arenicola]|uniref:ATP-grasp domain-containing protein n=1 Tax=Salinispora arenicola TaxID=168697 RepID=UPI00036ED875|nr:ATP-grasp domain-containing protein [Salinispora arenicola]